jgi:DNA-binding MarR family transcriptional regulator
MSDGQQVASRLFFPAMGVAVRALRARVDRALQAHGLRLGQFQILQMLWKEDGLTPRELAERLAVEMPTVTRTVQRMVRDGLVRREANPIDARSVRILLTTHGLEVRDVVSGVLEDETTNALDGFSPPECDAFVDFLDRVARNARRE